MNDDAKPKRKIYIALPTYSNTVRRDFMLSLIDVLFDKVMFADCEFTIGSVGGDGVGRSRNGLTQHFLLSTDCDAICFMDVDIRYAPLNLRRLLDHDKPIVAAQYAAKQMNHRWIMTGLPGEEADPITGLQKVQEAGTGFKLYKREVFEAMANAFPEIQYFCDGCKEHPVKWDFFSMGVVNGRYLSEDYYCDYRARKIGFDIWVDTKCQVAHQGFIDFPYTQNAKVFDGMTTDDVYRLAEKLGVVETRDPEGIHVWRSAA